MISWILWAILANLQTLGESHGNPDLQMVGQEYRIQPGTCEWHLKFGRVSLGDWAQGLWVDSVRIELNYRTPRWCWTESLGVRKKPFYMVSEVLSVVVWEQRGDMGVCFACCVPRRGVIRAAWPGRRYCHNLAWVWKGPGLEHNKGNWKKKEAEAEEN